jgi:hypothetical protein
MLHVQIIFGDIAIINTDTKLFFTDWREVERRLKVD